MATVGTIDATLRANSSVLLNGLPATGFSHLSDTEATGMASASGSAHSRRRCASGEEPEHPAPSLVLILVYHVRSNSIDIVHAGDTGTNESWLVGIEECFWWEFLANSAVICAAHVKFLECANCRLRPARVTPRSWLSSICGVTQATETESRSQSSHGLLLKEKPERGRLVL